MPGKGEGLSLAINLVLHRRPGKSGVGSLLEGEAIFIELRPAAVNTVIRRGRVAAIGQTKTLIGLVTLGDVHTEEFHHHLAACRPTPHRGLLRMKVNCLRANIRIRSAAAAQ